MALFIKPTANNIINLWFGADTPIRQHKIKYNPDLWEACQHTNRDFCPPSSKRLVEQYRKSDKVAFAKAVQQELERGSFSQNTHWPKQRKVQQRYDFGKPLANQAMSVTHQ